MPSDVVVAFLAQCEGVRSRADGWTARCPAHKDRSPSLSITAGDDGRVLLYCHAGCSTKAVVRALRLNLRDLFPPRRRRWR